MNLISLFRAIWTAGRGVTTGVTEATAESDPHELFDNWFQAARRSGVYLSESMTLATADRAGRPSARMVLLKGYGPDGFIFYTNYSSRKARDLEENPYAALVLHWSFLQRQIRIEGRVERVSHELSDSYFQSRPRGSRISAWASRQSESLPSRAVLENRVREIEHRFGSGSIPLPEFWGGYRLIPDVLEFWQGRINRLHDRLRFDRSGDGWKVSRLYP